MKRIVCLFCALSFAACASETSPSANDWPQWRGPHRNGISDESAWSTDWPKEGPKVLWKADIGVGYASVAVSRGRAYTMGNSGNEDTVWCFDAATGEVVWKQRRGAICRFNVTRRLGSTRWLMKTGVPAGEQARQTVCLCAPATGKEMVSNT